MKSNSRLMMFSLSACIAYTLAYYFDWSLFRYFPATYSFSLEDAGPATDQTILWYGWLVTASLAGAAVTALTPPRLVARFSPDLAWLVPAVLMLAALAYEKRWFI